MGGDGVARWSRKKPLPFRLVVVDEVSMVDMRMFALLLDALSPGCRLVLVGDMHQLPPIDAGAVLCDLTAGFDGAKDSTSLSEKYREELGETVSGIGNIDGALGDENLVTRSFGRMIDHVMFLTKNFRSVKGITEWWRLLRETRTVVLDDSLPVGYFTSGRSEADRQTGLWMDAFTKEYLSVWRDTVRPAILKNTVTDEIAGLFRRLIGSRRILCCVHEGEWGRLRTNARCDDLFRKNTSGGAGTAGHYDGQPVIVNSNQNALDLYNGDIGMVLEDSGALFGCFQFGSGIRKVALDRLSDFDVAYAISVHKSQGSEFGEVLLLVPEHSAMPVSVQLIYTAVTRARERVCIIDPSGVIAGGRLAEDDRPGLLRDFLK